jgi:hypothetical protein
MLGQGEGSDDNPERMPNSAVGTTQAQPMSTPSNPHFAVSFKFLSSFVPENSGTLFRFLFCSETKRKHQMTYFSFCAWQEKVS